MVSNSLVDEKVPGLGVVEPLFLLELKSQNPPSPSRSSSLPILVGSAGYDVQEVRLYSDENCQNLKVSASKAEWETIGIGFPVLQNSTTPIYGQALDRNRNSGSCVLLSRYEHDSVAPRVQIGPPSQFMVTGSGIVSYEIKVDGASEANLESSDIVLHSAGIVGCKPVILATGAFTWALNIDSCIGNGVVSVSVQAQFARDIAGNTSSGISAEFDFTVDNLPPNPPTFISANPTSPSSSTSPRILGLASLDSSIIMLFSNNSCSTLIGTGSKAVFENEGITAVIGSLATTDIYVVASDVLGNASPCKFLVSYNNMALQFLQQQLTINAAPGQIIPASATAGLPPYIFSLISGSGSLDPIAGVYTTSQARRGPSQLMVTDSILNTATATVNHVPIRTNGTVYSAVRDDTHWYLGGSFTAVNPIFTSYFALLDATTGDIDPLGCNFSSGFDGPVYATAFLGSAFVFVGGDFSSFSGTSAHRIAKINLATCTLDTTFTKTTGVDLGFDGAVKALALIANGIFVGGEFTNYRGANVNPLVKLNTDSGNLDTIIGPKGVKFQGPNGSVLAMSIVGTSLYIGGKFTSYGVNSAQHLAKVDTITGVLDQDFTENFGMDNDVYAIKNSGDSLYVGGLFRFYRELPAQCLAKVNLNSGNLDQMFTQSIGIASDIIQTAIPSGSQISGAVTALDIAGSHIYIGGNFTKYRGLPVASLAKIQLDSGSLDAGFISGFGADATVNSLSIYEASLILGGSFSQYRSSKVMNLVKIDFNNGDLVGAFTRTTGPNGLIHTLGFSKNRVFVGGAFTTYRGIPAENLARINAISGQLDSFFTQPLGMNNSVHSLALFGSSLYVGGDFTSYRGADAQHLAKVDVLSGVLDITFTKSQGMNNRVNSLVIFNEAIFVGGSFTTYRGSSRPYLAKMNLSDGNLTDSTDDFNLPSGFDNEVSSLNIANSFLFVGGAFTSYRGSSAKYLAKLNPNSGALDTVFTQVQGFDNFVYALTFSGSSLYVGGQFTRYRENNVQRLARVNLNSGNLDLDFAGLGGPDDTVMTLNISNSNLYIGGHFKSYRGLPANGVAKLELDLGGLNPAFAQSTGFIGVPLTMSLFNNSLFIGGTFTSYRGLPALYWTAVDLATGNLSD